MKRCLSFVTRWASPRKLLKRLPAFSGQSFVELAILLPLILIMLAGMVEVAFGMFTYLTALDLTREAARFASSRDYNELSVVSDCTDRDGNPITDPIYCSCMDDVLHYFYDTSCFFTDDALNPFLDFRADKFDDVVITVYTVAGDNVSEHHPSSGYWSLYSDNWQKDCQGNIVRTTPVLSDDYIESRFSSSAPAERGIVAVEMWLCYDMIMNLPVISDFIPSPFRFHAYTIMPAPEAIPTPTPITSP